ncbi:MAG: S8 family serine peptidase [Pseudomonadales bacterium]|nr:S8 family serine peptidase [Pseudomonadales bacterium]
MLRFRTRIPVIIASLLLLGGCANLQWSPSDEERFARQLVFTISNDRDEPQSEPFAGAESEEDSASLISKILRFHGLKKIAQWSVKTLGLEAIVAEVRGQKSVDEVVSALRSDGRVQSVQPVVTYKVLTYNDPYFDLQNSVNHEDIERVHGLATGKGVVVGVVDTGVDREHPELAGRLVYSRNFVDHDGRFDSDEHGTAVAGVISAEANNKVGIVGVAPDTRLMVFKACWQDVRGASCDSISLMKALMDVLERRPDILNLSLSGPEDPLIRQLLAAAHRNGMILIGAVDPQQGMSFPASMDEVIAVSSSLIPDDYVPERGVIAPGTDVLTTTPGATYAFKSGSSIATAYVSGVIALMKERSPSLSSAEAVLNLESSASSRIHKLPVVNLCEAVIQRSRGEVCPSGALVVAP